VIGQVSNDNDNYKLDKLAVQVLSTSLSLIKTGSGLVTNLLWQRRCLHLSFDNILGHGIITNLLTGCTQLSDVVYLIA